MYDPTRPAGAVRWRVLFMGTPEFAVPVLEALIAGPDEVVAVVAQPDKPAGRGGKIHTPPTVKVAKAHGIPVLQPTKVKVAAFPDALAAFRPDLIVVAAYGRILTEAVLAVPSICCVNVHGSLLPRYRGASPIQWAILRGETETGVTTMRMDAGLDTGDMLLKRAVPIPDSMTAGALHTVLSRVGAALLMETLAGMKVGAIVPEKQNHAEATLAPPLEKEQGLMDWSRSSKEISWHVRGMTPWPGAYTFLKGRRLVVLSGEGVSRSTDAEPGTVIASSASGLEVACGEGVYRLTRIKPENSKEMEVGAYLCGHPSPVGERFHDAE